MTFLAPNQPVATQDAWLAVQASGAAAWPAGIHQVWLVVVDSDGNQSAPAVLSVTIQPPPAPLPAPLKVPTP
jgi:hypothetical protein